MISAGDCSKHFIMCLVWCCVLMFTEFSWRVYVRAETSNGKITLCQRSDTALIGTSKPSYRFVTASCDIIATASVWSCSMLLQLFNWILHVSLVWDNETPNTSNSTRMHTCTTRSQWSGICIRKSIHCLSNVRSVEPILVLNTASMLLRNCMPTCTACVLYNLNVCWCTTLALVAVVSHFLLLMITLLLLSLLIYFSVYCYTSTRHTVACHLCWRHCHVSVTLLHCQLLHY